MTRLSERLAGRSAATGRPLGLFTVAITGFIGSGLLYVGATRHEDRTLNLVVGAFMAAAAVISALSQRRDTASWRSTELDGRPAWSLPIGAGPMAPAVATLFTILGLGLGIGAATASNTGVRILAALLASFPLVLAAELWRVALRRPELRISADLIELHGPGIDARLAWDDVAHVDYQHLGTRWAAVAVLAAADAASYTSRQRRLLLPMDREPDPPGIQVRLGLVPDASGLCRLFRALHAGGRPGREAMIWRGLPADSGY